VGFAGILILVFSHVASRCGSRSGRSWLGIWEGIGGSLLGDMIPKSVVDLACACINSCYRVDC
jgi:hypothetical protein